MNATIMCHILIISEETLNFKEGKVNAKVSIAYMLLEDSELINFCLHTTVFTLF